MSGSLFIKSNRILINEELALPVEPIIYFSRTGSGVGICYQDQDGLIFKHFEEIEFEDFADAYQRAYQNKK